MALRDRDLDALAADEAERALVNVRPTAKDWPPAVPPGPRVLPPPEPQRTEWTVKDEGWS